MLRLSACLIGRSVCSWEQKPANWLISLPTSDIPTNRLVLSGYLHQLTRHSSLVKSWGGAGKAPRVDPGTG
jgi:hypothetical protein